MQLASSFRGLALCSVLLFGALSAAGCSLGGADQPSPGDQVLVQIRRDMLGASVGLPISPLTSVHNGAHVMVEGKLSHMNEDWVVVEGQAMEHWIARDAVLLITVR